MRSYIRGRVNEELDLGTLAAKTVVGGNFDETTTDPVLCSSIVVTVALRDFTPVNNAGPIQVGIAHSDYSDPEIEACLEATGSWDTGNKIEQEISRRLVRSIGVLDIPSDANDSVSLNDGKPIKVKLNWRLGSGDTLKLWAYNLGAAAIATTTPVVSMDGHANLFQK